MPTASLSSLPAVHKHLVLHHYATKSRDEFELKMVRGSAMKRQRCERAAAAALCMLWSAAMNCLKIYCLN
jgi:hypothetical protein